jgi:hypothetical protein
MKKSKRHEISLDDAIKAVNESKIELAGSYGNGSHKTLQTRIIMIGNSTEVFYDVIDHNKCVTTINSLSIAVEKYNELP